MILFCFTYLRQVEKLVKKASPYQYTVSGKRNASSGICGLRRPRSDCASAQSDQGLRCPLTESSLDTRDCVNRQQMHG